jgi:Sulfatase-modifying factor enzyme 1
MQPTPAPPTAASASGPRPGISRARGEALRKAPPRPTRPPSQSGSNLIVVSAIALCALTALGLYFFVFSNSSEVSVAKRPPNEAASKSSNTAATKEPESPAEKSTPPPPPPKQLTLDIGSGESIELRRVQAGSFLMGSPEKESGRSDEEQSPQETKIERSFYLARYEISQSQYAAVMGVNPSQNKDPRQPVDTVSFLDAVEFCEKLSAKTSRSVRLPSEAEWEYACRAGTTTPFFFGETLSVDQANVDWPDAGAERRRESVAPGSYAANAWGFHDMHGNVWEWCQSNAEKNQLQILRGGSWMNTARQARSAARQAYQPGGRNSDYGFRIAVDLPETSPPAPTSSKPSDPNPSKK